MENIYFYPTLSNQLKTEADCRCGEYSFSYRVDNTVYGLEKKGASNLVITDPLETWEIDKAGLIIQRTIDIQYPLILKGENGIACDGADIGICIIWTSPSLKEMGYIMPESYIKTGNQEHYYFNYEFGPGEIKGSFLLETIMYIKKEADEVKENEQHLINEQGVTVGSVDEVKIAFDDDYMSFPIREVNDSARPIWWVDMDWKDPCVDMFDEDNVCVYLNKHYMSCPAISDTIKNKDILIEILSTLYLMLFEKIKEDDRLNDCLNGNFESGSIADVVNHFYSDQIIPLKLDPLEKLQETIHENVEALLEEGEHT